VLLGHPESPHWRNPQIGALTAVVAQWTLDATDRILVSMPTGSGKTAVETALPYLATAHRVLVVVPSVELRNQLAGAFLYEDVLREIGALGTTTLKPVVETVTGRVIDWERLSSADVVVALPQSISPAHFPDGGAPDPGFFDLIIIDEAHHAPAPTWMAILDHFENARAVLLTATPLRADGRRVPGTHAFHYPLRRAIADGIYQVVEPRILATAEDSTLDERDAAIAEAVVEVSQDESHRDSAVLVRAGTVARASKLQRLYQDLGLEVEVLTSTVAASERTGIIKRWRSGELRAVVTVDMLAEGFDLANLRIVGYHDKHKSVPVTMQFIGRLARVSHQYPQKSVLVTARDQDVYLALRTALSRLYAEDSEWSTLLPGLIDDEIQARKLDEQYLEAFDAAPGEISLAALRPLARAQIFEVGAQSAWAPAMSVSGEIPEELRSGARVGSESVAYAGLNQAQTQLVLITYRLETPRWYSGDDGLTRPVFDLHIVSWHEAARTDRPNLLFVNSHDQGMSAAIRELIDPDHELQSSDPRLLQSAFDSQERLSVSSVGVRNTFAGTPGTPAYAMFAGSGIERGLRDVDTNSRALGHAMAQVEVPGGSTVTAGLATGKTKYWETRYLGLRDYEAFTVDLAARYWFPRETNSGPLLPDVAKGVRTEAFATETVIVAAELHPAIRGQGWQFPSGHLLDMVDLQGVPHSLTATSFELQITDPEKPDVVLWRGSQDVAGRFRTLSGESTVSRGAGQFTGIDDLFQLVSPTVYFLNGETVLGTMTYAPVRTSSALPPLDFDPADWTGVDMKKEAKAVGRLDTVHDRVEAILKAVVPDPGTTRWVLCNDGPGEIADHIVIEFSSGSRPRVELWHSKFSQTGTPSVRVDDMQVVTQQAAKSRRHFTDRDFWKRLGRRIDGQEGPKAVLLSGPRDDLRALCGLDPTRTEESLADRAPTLDCLVGVVQPGLSLSALREALVRDPIPTSAGQVREFLTFLDNAVRNQATVTVMCSP
jgi:superfamily II DNA or RNA helicase